MRRLSLLLTAFALCSWAQDTAEVHSDRAAQLVQHGDLKSAEAELRRALQLSSADPKLLTSLGGVLSMQGKLEQANAYLARAVKLAPETPVFRRNLSANQWQLGRLAEARQNLKVLLESNPHDAVAIYLLGMVSENQKDYPLSASLLESVPEVLKQQPEASVALASDYYHTNRRDAANSRLKGLLNQNTKPEVLWMAGRVAMEAHNYPLALDFETEAANRLRDSYQVFSMKASAELKLRYYSQAVLSAERAVQLHSSIDTQRQLAEARWRSGDKVRAELEFENLIRQSPKDAATPEIYGTLLLQDGPPGERMKAIRFLKQALALNGASVEAQYQLANVELTGGNLESAKVYLERAIKTEPDDARLHFALSRLYQRLDRATEAEREMQQYQRLKAEQN